MRRLLAFGCAALLCFSGAFAQDEPDDGAAEGESLEAIAERSVKAAEQAQATIAAQALALDELRTRQAEALRAIAELRRDTLGAAQRNDEAMSARLKLIEENLAQERAADLKEIRDANRSTLLIVSAVAVAAFLCLLIALLYLVSIMRRLAEAVAVFPGTYHAFRDSGHPGALGSSGAVALPAGDPIKLSAGQLLETIEQLQRNVRALQEGTHLTPGANGDAGEPHPAAPDKGAQPVSTEATEKAALISSLMGKGNTLLNMGQADAALNCYQEVLSIDGECTDALVKKGKALEKLRRMEEAIESYDRALMVDSNLTIAHLGKGGVLNRMERYAEALECYERAMQTQQKTAATG